MWLEFLGILRDVAGFFGLFVDFKEKPKLSALRTLALVISFAATIFLEKEF